MSNNNASGTNSNSPAPKPKFSISSLLSQSEEPKDTNAVIVIDDSTDIEEDQQEGQEKEDSNNSSPEVTVLDPNTMPVELSADLTATQQSKQRRKPEQEVSERPKRPARATRKKEEPVTQAPATSASKKAPIKKVMKPKVSKAAEIAAAMRAAASAPAGTEETTSSQSMTILSKSTAAVLQNTISKSVKSPSVPPLSSRSSARPSSSKRTDIFNLMNHDDEGPGKSEGLLPSQIPKETVSELKRRDLTFSDITGLPEMPAISKDLCNFFKPATTTTTTTTSTTPPGATSSTANTTIKSNAKAPTMKKADPKDSKSKTPKGPAKKSVSGKPVEEPSKLILTPEQAQNQALKAPKPNINLPPPKLLDVPSASRSPNDSSSKEQTIEEPIIVMHVPLKTPNIEAGSTQIVFNVLKMAEDKYGWRNIHPNASKFSELINDEDFDDDDMEDDEEVVEPEEPKEPVNPQKGKPKVGQYDYEDPFIDDAELVYEEQRASTKDGFFVFYGPLVEEGKKAHIEKVETGKRGRKRPGTVSGNGTGRKKATLASAPVSARQSTPRPLVAIAPQPLDNSEESPNFGSK